VYAVIDDGGHQYKVAPGDVVEVELQDLEPEQTEFAFDKILMVGDGKKSRIGQPYVEGARVTAKVLGEVKGPKLTVIKFRRRKGYKRKAGHRQRYLRLQIETIEG
jgi:large subunit ribosomal protein L21